MAAAEKTNCFPHPISAPGIVNRDIPFPSIFTAVQSCEVRPPRSDLNICSTMFAVFTKLESQFSTQMRQYATTYATSALNHVFFFLVFLRWNSYNQAQETYMEAAKALKEATGPYKASDRKSVV